MNYVSIFLGDPSEEGKAKSSATFGCPVPAKIADGNSFSGTFHDIAPKTKDTWEVPSNGLTFGKYSLAADKAPSVTINPDWPVIDVPQAVFDGIKKEIEPKLA